MREGKATCRCRSCNGSVLILVLWVLVLLSFLAEQYLGHNRGKAGLAANGWNSLRQEQAVDSVIQLFSTDAWPIPDQQPVEGTWYDFSPGGIDLKVKVEDESKKIDVNTAQDQEIRQAILARLGEERFDEADELADAVLDWRDSDSLTRTNGAEAGYYKDQGLPYEPADGPFKVLTELLLVRGMTADIFWGDPLSSVSDVQDTEEADSIVPAGAEGAPETPQPLLSSASLAEDFTIYPKDVKRVSIVIPGRGRGYLFVLAFLQKEGAGWKTVQLYRTMLVGQDEEIPEG
jgi:hypothetical protein